VPKGKKCQAAFRPPSKELGALGVHLCADEGNAAGDKKNPMKRN